MTDSDATQRDEGPSLPEAPAPAAHTAEAPVASVDAHDATPVPTEGSADAPRGEGPPAEAEAHGSEPSGEEGEQGPETSGDGAEEASEPSGEGDAEGAASSGEPGGEPGAKKKKRRRRKKKKGAGAEGAPSGEGEAKPSAHVPFLQYFEGGAGKKHAFTTGEVVAGRVLQVADGTVSVDLFGKAVAYVDVYEPHEIPILTEAARAAQAEEEAEDEGHTEEEAREGAEAVAAPEASGDETTPGTEEAPTEAAGETVPGAEAPVSEAEAPVSEAEALVSEAEGAAPEGAEEAAASESAEEAAASESVEEAAASESVEEAAASESAEEAEEKEPAPAVAPAAPPPEPPAVGAIFRGRVGSVSESGHIAIVNRIVDRKAAKERLRVAQQEHRRVEGVVYGFNRGGFDVLMEGIRVFCPAAAMTLEPIHDPHPFLGRKLEFTVAPTKGGGKSVIVSRRTILEKELRKKARDRMKKLIVGERLDGTVTEVRDYGLIVDIGEGLDGLVHMSEVSWNRADKPSDVAKVGDRVEVEVLKVTPASRKDRFGRVSLSMRRCQRDPWELAAESLKEGAAFKGRVVRATEFGAFVELVPGVEGLLHISELGGKDLTHAKQAVDEGDTIDVAIERLDRGARRISLSRLTPADLEAMASGEFDPSKAPKSLKQGAHIDVIVERVEHHGLFVQAVGVLGRRGRGYVSNRELGEGGDDRRRAFAPGTKLQVKIIGTDRNGQLRCSVKALLVDEERRAVKDYRKEAARQGFGTFGDLLKAKLERDGK